MKTKFIITLILLAFFAFDASAWKIIIAGGGKDNKFNYIKVTRRSIECRGTGNNTCPVDFTSAQSYYSPIWHPLGDVTDFVMKQVAGGNTTGEAKYENDLPISWKTISDGGVEIDVEASDVKGLEDYDQSE